MKYKSDPRYQRAVQYLSRMGPENKAIFSTYALDESFADEETRKMMQGMLQASENEYRDKAMSLRAGAQKTEFGLRRRAMENYESQLPIAQGLGLANVGASAYFGNKEKELAEAEAAENRKLMRRYYGGA